ncbi:MAG: glycosyltransferase family 2 protein [Anaerolineales bacterium]|nr:glycosyltransferase family 2 protein [Anaerolineales bacterium]
MWLAWVFWIGLAIVLYTYAGYGILVIAVLKLRRTRTTSPPAAKSVALPAVSLIIPAYNEAGAIAEKFENSLALDYPRERLTIVFVTDGSNDGTDTLLQSLQTPPGATITVLHSAERRGKLAAVERVMPTITTPITVFSDANTLLNHAALQNLVRHYTDPSIGAVAGEKRVHMEAAAGVQGVGEGLYWKYESWLKRLDAELYSVVGAAGELFSVRTTLYESVPPDSIIEDFELSMRIAMRGYRVAYAPDAYAVEEHSSSLGEEWKRKVRISAGGLQSVIRLRSVLNPFRYGILSFQYISHRVLRWTLAPLLLPVIFLANAGLMGAGVLYVVLLIGQLLFYGAALAGLMLEQLGLRVKLFYIPMYFCVMNCAVYVGALRLLRGKQSAVWEKAQRT